MNTEHAADLARDALIWLAGHPDELGTFLAASGAGADTIGARAGDPEFLGFVLDFLLGADEMVLGFAAETGHAPDSILRARAALPGGALPDWT